MAPLPKHIIRVACVAGGIAVFQSAAVIVAASVLLAFYSRCGDAEATLVPSQLFTRQLRVHYFQDASCGINGTLQEGLMESSELYVWLIITLSFSVVWLVASICLFMVADEKATEYFGMVAYAWSAATAAVVVVDVTMAVMLGLDFGTLHRRLADIEILDATAYELDVLRLGVLLLMSLALKGYILFAANIGYAVVLIIAGNRARQIALVSEEHSVHTRGPLNAFATTHKRTSDPWTQQQQFDTPFERGTQINRAFVDSENLSIPSWRDAPNDYTNRSFDRSDSWHHSRTGADTRPFSYLEEPRGRAEATPSPAVLPPWRRDPWEQTPPVPAPDYSPLGGRRLKSALKTTM